MAPILAHAEPAVPPALTHCCPLCAGPIEDVRGQSRCQRCRFTICESCDGEAGEATPACQSAGH